MSGQEEDIDILARTIYGEARSEGLPGMEAVASVVMNRLAHSRAKGGGHWWGNSVREICLKPYQFSCWLPDDVNSGIIRNVTEDNPVFRMCLRVASRAVCGVLLDSTWGADHYHAKTVHPKWAQKAAPVAEIGAHLFYRLEGEDG